MSTSNVIQPRRLPIEEHVEKFLTARPDFVAAMDEIQGSQPGKVSQRKVDFMNTTVSRSEAAITQVWALRRLGESFPPEKLGQLRTPYSWILQDMAKDHLKELKEQVRALRGLLSPLLSEIAGDLGNRAMPSNPKPISATSDTVVSSNMRPTMELFESIRQVQVLTLRLFGSEESWEGTLASDSRGFSPRYWSWKKASRHLKKELPKNSPKSSIWQT